MKDQNKTKSMSDVWGVSSVWNIKLDKILLVASARDILKNLSNINYRVYLQRYLSTFSYQLFWRNYQMFDRVLNTSVLADFWLSVTRISLNNIHCVKCPYSEFFWSLFSRIRTEYGDLLRKSPYLVRMQENKDQK